ncbi:DsbA family protein [Streptomyces sp. NPDC006477]|uniref:DsbA family protein n=1 Tax=Streptomyces sp. NPDC006477 TaxID=3364747 RepID=UPI003681288B
MRRPSCSSEQRKFVEYHRVLFDDQATVEASGGFTTDRLLKLAAKVPGLRGEAFGSAVRTMKYRAFVAASDRAFGEAGENSLDAKREAEEAAQS